VLFAEQDQTPNHNGGMLAFGADGYLYIAIGDDGTGGGTPPDAQRLDVVFGKILRIDVNSGNPYAIPPTNPFVGRAGARGEIWALGLRNPWRFSFDRATGDLWIGDVGQFAWEEIDRQPAGTPGGANYQWPCREGQHVFRSDLTCGQGASTPPIFEYPHGDAPCSAITGGYVYRGSAMPGFLGAYLYTDSCQDRVWALRGSASEGWTNTLLATLNAAPVSFMEDRAGELYLADYSAGQQILRLSEAGIPSPPPTSTRTPTATPRPSAPTATPTPTQTAAPSRTSTPTPTSTPGASLPTLTVTFDSLPVQAGILSSELPEGVIDWGQNAWVHLPPFGNFPSQSITFAEPSNQITNGWFTLVGGRRLVSLDAYNVGPTLSYASLGCYNAQLQPIQPVRTFSIDSGQALTLRTGWTARCDVVTLGSATGQLLHFDNLVVESLGPDLVITSFTATDGTADADPRLSVTVRNRGDRSTAGFLSDVHFFADLGRPPTPADFGFKAHLGGIDLAPGASWTGETHFPGLGPASHTLWALADAHNVVRESDETNNVASASVKIANAPIVTVTFDNLPPQAALLTGEYPAGLINWGSNRWVHLVPAGRFPSKSITFVELTTGITSSWFDFVGEGRLVALDAFNLTASVSYVSLGCYNAQQQLVQPVGIFALQPDTVSTLRTGWTARCHSVTIGSANGQMTHFDNLVVDSLQP
jgi:Glucose / Sorbosone dehydrogenase/CARDB